MADEILIKISDLHFSYQNGKMVFQGLDFSLKKGERIGLVGPNGAGKTTLFHIVMGLLRPLSGSIEIFQRIRKAEAEFLEVRQRIGLLFQDSDDQLFCPTVEEDIAFGPLNLGKSHNEAQKIVKETCAKLGLSGYERRITHRLSGGEKRRVALATVMAMQPECYLFDEPTSGLDEASTDSFLKYLNEQAGTYVMITHNHDLLSKNIDRVFRLSDGKLKTL
jgi:cobalt/nickel transport system ATP-binding protein